MPKELLAAVREQRLEGIIGKQKESQDQAGKRSGTWIRYRVNRGQEFVIGGYFPGPHGFDSLIVGYYDGGKLMYVARTRNGFVPASRRQVFSKLIRSEWRIRGNFHDPSLSASRPKSQLQR